MLKYEWTGISEPVAQMRAAEEARKLLGSPGLSEAAAIAAAQAEVFRAFRKLTEAEVKPDAVHP